MTVLPGHPYPLGATVLEGGVNFALFSEHAESVTLCLFDSVEATESAREIRFTQKSDKVWYAFVPGLEEGQIYGYRVDGPYDLENGHRFNRNKVLLDPYARELARSAQWDDSLFGYHPQQGDTTFNPQDSSACAALGRVQGNPTQSNRPAKPNHKWSKSIIYETHVKGISMLHPDVPEAHRGTYLGLISPPILDHLKNLGVTTIELLPVQAKLSEFNLHKANLRNYWGYSPLGYFAPEPSYASHPDQAIQEFRQMVDGLHEAGLEVILDVVYNHTAEGSRLGPTISFRGLDNKVYYREVPEKARYLQDYTGTGNTLDVRKPVVRRLIADSLRYWAENMGVDGFRFDLAVSLAREGGGVKMDSALLSLLKQDPVLQKTKLIAEPWDLGPDGYKLGTFPAPWREWNAKYRDTIRQYWTGHASASDLATPISGSSDLFHKRRPLSSINFITAHDGFTLEDTVSYAHKHNLANLEDNRDGHEPNYSSNWGEEGPTPDEGIAQTRHSVKKALLSTLFLSQGVPMLLGGDELGRTQQGNNNAYCQDNEISWYNWADQQVEWTAFVRETIAFRKAHPSLSRHRFLKGGPAGSVDEQAIWWHPEGRPMRAHDWSHSASLTLGLILPGNRIQDVYPNGDLIEDDTLLLVFNSTGHDSTVVLPAWGTFGTGCAPFCEETQTHPSHKILIHSHSVGVFRSESHP